MMRGTLLAVLLVSSVCAAASAAPAVYVDEVVVAGGPDAGRARSFVTGAVQRANMTTRFAGDATPCGDDGTCLAMRARSEAAVVALRVAIVEVGGRIVVSMLASDRRGATRREIVDVADLDVAQPAMVDLLRGFAPAVRRPSRRPAWTLLGVSTALALGGGIATYVAYDRRASFYADHVAPNGDVIGISPADARVEERGARRWSLVGLLALGGAAIGGTAATILFVRDPSGEARPAGMALAWELR
jgi:hypothetical protein